MNRYLVFAGYWYYPDGGWRDMRVSFDTWEEAEEWIKEHVRPENKEYEETLEQTYDWANVIDIGERQ